MNRDLTRPGVPLRCAAAAVGAVLLAGCASTGSHGSGSSGTQGADRGAITLATAKDTSGNLQKQVDAWNAAHPSERVTIDELPTSADAQLQQMVQNAQVKSDAYTVLALDVVWTAEFASHRWIDPLPDFAQTGFLAPALETAKYRGTLYAAPWQSNGGLLFYRSDLLDKAGVKPPTTWQQLQDDCAKVAALPEGKGVNCYAGQLDKYEGLVVNFSEAVQSAGGTLFDKDGKPTVGTPQAKAALGWLVNAFKDGTIPHEALTYHEEDGRRSFQAGQLVFLRQWPYLWDLGNKTDGSSKVAGQFNVAPLPGLNGPGSSTLGGANLAVSAYAKHKATAKDFIAYLTGEDAQRANLLATSQAPTRADLYDDPAMQAKFPYLAQLKQSIQTAVPRPSAVRYGDVSSAIQDAIAPVIAGQATPDAALADLQKKLEELTAQ
ncbi:ABC transporter substrate-binding protein [Kitasatospora sp. NPDC001159]